MTEGKNPPHRVLRIAAVMEKTGLRKDSVYRGGRENWFPRPIKINERASGWIEAEVDAFIERRMKLRDTSRRLDAAAVVSSWTESK